MAKKKQKTTAARCQRARDKSPVCSKKKHNKNISLKVVRYKDCTENESKKKTANVPSKIFNNQNHQKITRKSGSVEAKYKRKRGVA